MGDTKEQIGSWGRRHGLSRFIVPHPSFLWLTRNVWILALGTAIFLGAVTWSYDYYLFRALDLSEAALNSPGAERYLRFTILNAVVVAIAFAVYMTIMTGFLFHRVSGPIYRIKAHMEAVAAGEITSECVVRDGDQLQDVCLAYNQLLRSLDVVDAKPLTEADPVPGCS